MGIDVPTEIGFFSLLARISPSWMQAIGRFFLNAKRSAVSLIGRGVNLLPHCFSHSIKTVAAFVEKVALRCISLVVAIVILPIRACVGGLSGKGGKKFQARDSESEHVKPSLLNGWKNLFRLPKFHLPGVLQEWMRQQPSTVVYKRPVKLTLVP